MAVGGLLHAIQFARHQPEPVRQASLLMVLASGVVEADMLSTTLRSLVNESESPWSDRVLHLVLLLEQGHSLSRALSTVERLLPEESIVAIRIAEEAGSLESVLNGEAIRLLSLSERPQTSNLITSIATLFAVSTVMVSVVTFVMVRIIPKFAEIFEGFGIDLPVMTVMLIQISTDFFGIGMIAWAPTVAGLTGLCIFGWKIHSELLGNGRSGWLDWRSRHRSPMVLRMLSLTIATGATIADGLRAALAEIVPSRSATQLSRVRHELSSGSDLSSALQANGFITRRESRFLESATKTNHVDWAMRHLATDIERRRQVWSERLSMIIPPIMILILGAAVGFVVIALFLPLIQLLSDLS